MDLATIFLSFLEGENNVEETAKILFTEAYGKEAPEVEFKEKKEFANYEVN